MRISGQNGSGKIRYVYRLNAMYGGAPPKKIFVFLRNSPTVIWWHGTEVYKSELHHGLPSTETIDDLREAARIHSSGRFNAQIGAVYIHGGIIIECLVFLSFVSQVTTLSQQLYPGSSRLLVKAYKDAKEITWISLLLLNSRENVFTCGDFACVLNIYEECQGCLAGDYTESTALFRKFSTPRRSFQIYTKQPFGYLVIDTSPKTDDKYRLRTNVFPR